MLDAVNVQFHNLPSQLTPLIGREQERQAVCTLLRRPGVRLVTLTGTGGVGKTRLSLQVATDLLDDFCDGVCFIQLAPVSDPELVVATITRTLGIKEVGERSLLDLLKSYLQDKHLLLLPDNFEQVLPAAPQLSNLLAACPHVKVLVTSRAVLHVHGEHEYPVPPLALPDLSHLPESETISQYASVALFLERARAARPNFTMTAVNSRTIAEICVRLDGLPLAIELAGARINLLPPQALLTRLEHRLAVLTSGTGDSAWWEHKTLAARMNADLVQPKDLVVTDGGVFRLEHGRRYSIDVLSGLGTFWTPVIAWTAIVAGIAGGVVTLATRQVAAVAA